jgi:hypothetical protein
VRTLQEFSVFGFKDNQAGVEQFAFRHHDDVAARSDLVQTENLSYQPFRTISLNRSTELFRRRDSEPPRGSRFGPRQHEQRAVAAVNLDASVVNLLKVCPAADSLVGTKHLEHVPRQPIGLFAADGEPFAPFGATTLQHEATILGAHPNEKSVRLRAMTPVRLKCSYALRHGPSSL